MREEHVNDMCNWSETQATLECPDKMQVPPSVSQIPAEGGLPT